MTLCPVWTNLRAMAAPKPALAPVIITIMKRLRSRGVAKNLRLGRILAEIGARFGSVLDEKRSVK
jgi:hypothetical protein